jgi:hypothetical protein
MVAGPPLLLRLLLHTVRPSCHVHQPAPGSLCGHTDRPSHLLTLLGHWQGTCHTVFVRFQTAANTSPVLGLIVLGMKNGRERQLLHTLACDAQESDCAVS